GNAAAGGTPVFDRRLELFTDRTPEGDQHPLRARRILPRADRPPHAARVERLRVVADERRRVERRPMILAAERIAIEQPDPAFLARADEELASLVIERDGRRVHVEVAPPEPVRI